MATQETEKPVKSDTPKLPSSPPTPTKARLSTPAVETSARSTGTTPTVQSSQDMPIATPPTDAALISGQMPAVQAAASTSAITSNEATVFTPDPKWPPPILLSNNAKMSERHYMEHRWYGQWSYYDQRAEQNKQRYLLLQGIIVVGSVAVPVLISIGPSVQAIFAGSEAARAVMDVITIILSLSVAVAAGLERLYKYGEYWSSYRNAAEELMQEKALFDTRSGPYKESEQPFLDFVNFTEEIIAQQNGRWIQARRSQDTESAQMAQGIIDRYGDEYVNSIPNQAVSYSTPIPPSTD